MITEAQFCSYGANIELGAKDWQAALGTVLTLPDGTTKKSGDCTRADLLAISEAIRAFVAAREAEIQGMTDDYLAKHELLWKAEGSAEH